MVYLIFYINTPDSLYIPDIADVYVLFIVYSQRQEVELIQQTGRLMTKVKVNLRCPWQDPAIHTTCTGHYYTEHGRAPQLSLF